MSIFQSLGIGIAAIQAQSTRIGMLSDNLANVSTVGYKKHVADFRDLISYSESPSLYSPGGMRNSGRQLNRIQGQIIASDSPTDVAINGNGFFAVRAGSATSSDIVYTRAGSFRPNRDGDFINGAGFFLQGWRLENQELPSDLATDNLAASAAIASLETVNINNLTEDSVPTTSVILRANLQASYPIYSGTPAYNAASATANMADGGIDPSFNAEVTVVDSEGETHTLLAGFLKTGINTWAMEIYAESAADMGTASAQIAAGTVTFNGDGTLNSVSSGLTSALSISWQDPVAATNTLTFDLGTAGDMFGTPGATTIGLTDGLGQLDIDFSAAVEQNGYEAGTLNRVEISEDGFVSGIYANGTVQRFYKIPLALFIEPNELANLSGNIFSPTDLSGDATFSQPKRGGAGGFDVAALENSNVDLSSELTDMIVAQRAYQSNTKTISTSDAMLQELTRMVG